jgi:hypothetical protein
LDRLVPRAVAALGLGRGNVRCFRYRLQAAFERFCDEEAAAQRALGAAEAKLAAECHALAGLVEKAAISRELLRGAGSVPALAAIDRRLVALDAAERRQRERIAQARRGRAEALAELERAARLRSALQRHRERAQARHVRDAELREAAELDEFNALGTGLA